MVSMTQAVSALKETNLFLTGVFLITSGFGFLLGWTLVVRLIIEYGVSLREGSLLVKLWRTNPMPLDLQVYAFNWTNPQDFRNLSTKPKFTEIGPFVFKETKTKENIVWHDHNDSITFNQIHRYQFDRSRSVADLDLKLTSINPIMVAAAYEARKHGYFMRKGLQFSFNAFSQQVPVTKKIGELLFDGYKDTLITLQQKLPFGPSSPFDKVGWLYQRNGTKFEGIFNMGTSYRNFGELKTWQWLNRTKYYPESCSEFKGSAGELYPPNVSRGIVHLFCPDLCRTLPLDYETDTQISGITGYKFSADVSLLDNGTLIPENSCYCMGDCLPSGVLNISSCKYGAPGFASLPHFYNADPFYVNAVEGMKPNKSRHEFYVVLEPTTGIPLEVAAAFQVNVLVQPVQYFTLMENVPRVMFPILWLRQKMRLPQYLVVGLQLFLWLPTIFQVLGVLLLAIGMFLIMLVVYRQIIQSMRQQNESSIRELVPLNEKVVIYQMKETAVTDVRQKLIPQ